MDGGEEVAGCFVIARGDGAEIFELTEEVFDEVAVRHAGGHFIFVCKPSSHVLIEDYRYGIQLETLEENYRNRTQLSLKDISRLHNPILRGWVAYYGRFQPSAMYPVFRHFNKTLVAWAMRKYRRLKGHKTRASLFVETISKTHPHLFVHWQKGTPAGFA